MKEYLRVWAAVEEPEIADLVFRRFPWPEMQLATLIWSGRWTNVDLRYASIGGYPSPDKVWGIHYAGLKPWKAAQPVSSSLCEISGLSTMVRIFSSHGLRISPTHPERHAPPFAGVYPGKYLSVKANSPSA